MKFSTKIAFIIALFYYFLGSAQVYRNHDYNYWLANNYTLINPADVFTTTNSSIGLNYNSYFGAQKIFKQADFYYFHKSNSKLKIGGHIFTDIEEQFSSLTQVDFLLAYQIIKKRDLEINVGSYFGAKNFLVHANAFYGGSSSWDFDWRFGGTLKSNKHTVGLSLQHFIPVQFTPLNQTIKFDKEISTYYSFAYEIESNIVLKPTSMFVWREILTNQFYWGAALAFDKKVDLHFQLEQINSLLLGGNINIARSKTQTISFGFDYYVLSQSVNSKGYQLRLKYAF